jgi:KDO2-lipid IV(A) lauroyltransferase
VKSGAAVLPGFLLWHADEVRYVLHFGEEIEMARTDDAEQDILTNTARCTAAIESYVRRYPEQWLWVHRRWKTRPAGEGSFYA